MEKDVLMSDKQDIFDGNLDKQIDLVTELAKEPTPTRKKTAVRAPVKPEKKPNNYRYYINPLFVGKHCNRLIEIC